MTRVANRPVFKRTILNCRPSVLVRVGNQVLPPPFFFWRPPCKNTARGHGDLQKKKRSTPGFSWVVLHNRDWAILLQNFFRSRSKFFSALQIKDNSKFNKGQGRGVQIKDCLLK